MSTPGPRLTQPLDSMLGATLVGKYKILKKLGEGGMGSVYLAQQMPIERHVAIKVLLGKLAEDEIALKRFEQEARAISKMQHPNTVTIYDYGQTEDGRLYIVMEYLKGRTLAEALRATSGTGLEPRRAVAIFRQVCASLAEAHRLGVIHRDLKPDNIFLTEVAGSKDWVKVLDFGVAKLANEAGGTLTQTGMIFGTPKYMSPEQAEGRGIDARADIYTIGVVLYETLVGRPPFLADSPVALLLKHIQESPASFQTVRPGTAIAAELEAIVMKALEKDPDRRFREADELARALDHCLEHLPTSTSRPSIPLDAVPGQARPLPTEVNPLDAPEMSARALPSPHDGASSLSLGSHDIRRLPTEPAPRPLGPSANGPATGAQTFQSFTPASNADPAQVQTDALKGAIAAHAATQPGQVTQTGAHTLGGSVEESPQELVRYDRTKNRRLFWAGGLLVGAIVTVALVASLKKDEIQTRPLAQPGSDTTSGIGATPAAKGPLPTPMPTNDVAPPATTETSPNPTEPTTDAVRTKAPDRARAPSTRHEKAGAEAPKPASANAPKKVSIAFSSTPPGAVVEDADGIQLGLTPFSREYLKGTDVIRVTFKKDGFKHHTEVFGLASARSVNAELVAERASPIAPPHLDGKKTLPKKKEKDRTLESIHERVDDLKEVP